MKPPTLEEKAPARPIKTFLTDAAALAIAFALACGIGAVVSILTKLHLP